MRRSKAFIYSLREALLVSLSFTLAALLLAAISAHAQDTAATNAPGWVVIPVEEYRTLRAKAFPAEREPEPPPVEATLTRVDYSLRVNGPGDLATGQASLTVDVIKDGWVRVAIPSGLLVREARLDGKPVSLVSGGPGKASSQLSAVLAHPGRAVLQLEIALPVSASAGEERITLPSTGSGVTRAAVELPRQGVDVQLTGGLLAESAEAGSESKWLAYGRGNEPLTFMWRRKIDDHHITLPLRARGSIRQLMGLGEDATSLSAEADLEIIQGAAKEARLLLPDNITINQVSGAMVADWEVKSGELRVIFLEPVEGSARFVINGDTHTPREGKIEIPLLRMLNVERENGGIAVEVLGAGEIKDQKPHGLEIADASELGDGIASHESPSMVSYRFRPGDSTLARSLSLDVARYAQQAVLTAVIDEARYHILMSYEGKVLIQARYAVRNNQRNFLKITLPQGAAIWSATLAGKPVRPGQAPDGAVLLPLEKSRAGDEAPVFPVEVLYLSRQPAWTDKGKARMELPALDLPVSRSAVMLFHAPQFKVTAEPGTFRLEPYEAPFSPALTAVYSPESGFSSNGLRGRDKVIDGQNNNDADSVTVKDRLSQSEAKALEDFRAKSMGGKSAKVLPIKVSFPAFGTSLFLVSELTAENQAPAIELSYQRAKKDGGQ
ncbi:MAG TPA: hypothetical protein VKW06_19755 [Candidatus Angelobacter sp.]|nr:hypothetical protein [Candidatus Angelobacter sp.]